MKTKILIVEDDPHILLGLEEVLKSDGFDVAVCNRGDHAMDAFAGAVGVSDSDGKATPVYAVCQPKPGVNAHYYAFIVREMARSSRTLAHAQPFGGTARSGRRRAVPGLGRSEFHHER